MVSIIVIVISIISFIGYSNSIIALGSTSSTNDTLQSVTERGGNSTEVIYLYNNFSVTSSVPNPFYDSYAYPEDCEYGVWNACEFYNNTFLFDASKGNLIFKDPFTIVNATRSIILGEKGLTQGVNLLTLGTFNTNKGTNNLVIGTNNNNDLLMGDSAVVIGAYNYNSGNEVVLIGTRNNVFNNANNNFAIGTNNNNYYRYANSIGHNLRNYGFLSVLVGNQGTNYINNSFVVNLNADPVLMAEYNKGVRIGDITGESITMTGNELYVKGNTEIDGFLVLGSNSESGLTTGDINASKIYYDVLIAKSPIVMCSNNDCKVTVPELKQDYYIKKDENYTILSFDKTLPQEVINKFTSLKNEKLEENAIKSCISQGEFYEYVDKKCTLNKKSECESDGYSYWTGALCLENPYLKCESSNSYSWDFDLEICVFNSEKDCEYKGWNFDILTKQCTKPIIPEKDLDELKKECLADKSQMWNVAIQECQKLELYLAKPYKQPAGAHDSYPKGSIIIWNNKYYESLINANVWSPSAYPAGWKVI